MFIFLLLLTLVDPFSRTSGLTLDQLSVILKDYVTKQELSDLSKEQADALRAQFEGECLESMYSRDGGITLTYFLLLEP